MCEPISLRFLLMKANEPARIEINGEGEGEISDEAIAQRAAELARIDGRTHPAGQDIFHAREELTHPGPPPPPEADETEQPVGSWSDSAASKGHQAYHAELEDEQSAAEQLVEEGVEEADHEQRLAASEDLAEE
jgi:nucleotide-binding universal stress UspA family protein